MDYEMMVKEAYENIIGGVFEKTAILDHKTWDNQRSSKYMYLANERAKKYYNTAQAAKTIYDAAQSMPPKSKAQKTLMKAYRTADATANRHNERYVRNFNIGSDLAKGYGVRKGRAGARSNTKPLQLP